MCNVEICGLCCTVNGQIVPCDEGGGTTSTGTIVIDDNSGVGTMIYALDINDPQEANIINNGSAFHVDEDMAVTGVLILQGDYSYDPSIGNYGGYTIDAVEN